MDLSNLQPALGSKHSNNFRRGRGESSGNGKTAGKGSKGQKARSGAPRPGFEGGQMPLFRRLPKRGFTDRNSKNIVAINIISKIADGVKILGNGDLTKKITLKNVAASETAKKKIEAAGGTVEVD